jgi:signal transduction histidine kinase
MSRQSETTFIAPLSEVVAGTTNRLGWLKSGPIVTGTVILVHLALSAKWPSLRGVSSLTVLAVVYATYRDGLESGALSGLFALVYFAFAFSEKRVFDYGRPEIERLTSLALVIPGVVGLVHTLKLRLVQSELERSLLAERAERQNAEAAQEQRYRHLAEAYTKELERRVVVRTQELAAAITSLEEVSSAIAHDLRNPVRYVAGYAELLNAQLAGRLDPQHQSFLTRIGASAGRIDRLINDLLRYTGTHSFPSDCSAVEPEPIIHAVLRKLEPLLRTSGAQMRVEGTLPTLWANPRVLEEVLENLLSNAAKFGRTGTKPLVVVSSISSAEGPRLLVTDNGRGVPPENVAKLFKPFSCFDPETNSFGSGIGLAVVAKGMRQIGGNVGVESKLGQGSTFWLQFQSPPTGYSESLPSRHFLPSKNGGPPRSPAKETV